MGEIRSSFSETGKRSDELFHHREDQVGMKRRQEKRKKILRLEAIELLIRDGILSGEYRAGERLVEADLIKKYSVSRTIVRESLRNLNATGLVSYIPKKGHSVRKFSKEDVKDIYDIICVLEGYASEIAVPFFNRRDIRNMKELNEKMKVAASAEDFKEYRRLNVEFHKGFATMSGNRSLEETLENLRTKVYTYRYLSMLNPDAMDAYVKGHEKVIKAATKKDPQKVRLEMQEHIKTVRDNLIISIERSPLI